MTCMQYLDISCCIRFNKSNNFVRKLLLQKNEKDTFRTLKQTSWKQKILLTLNTENNDNDNV